MKIRTAATRLARGILVAGLAGAFALGATLPAQAYTYSTSGTPGYVGVTQTSGYGRTTYDANQNRIDSGPITVYRSSGYSGTQIVTITWAAFHWTAAGGWTRETSGTDTWTLYPGQYAPDLGWHYDTNLGGAYATNITVTWKTPAGAFIGQKFDAYTQASDYYCTNGNCWISMNGGQYTITVF
jgi:hypothetical protein